MNLFSPMHPRFILVEGYFLCFVALNVILLLISLYYRKKFQHSSPRWGFLAAIALAFLSCILLFGEGNGVDASQSLSLLSIVGSALASIYSTARLFYIMQRVQK